MFPQQVLYCIRTLEQAGYQAYGVGGCVRDTVLGLTPHDWDLCTDASPEETSRIFAAHDQVLSGKKHGTVGVILEHRVYEITTFRTEGGYRDNRHPDWVRFVPELREDLARRDFTVNAMAMHPDMGIIDPFGGQQDLRARCLRAVGDPRERFSQDALRILRGVRFAVRFGLTPERATHQAMEELAPLMEHLARERVYTELSGLLPHLTAELLLSFAPVILQVIPELKAQVGFLQHSPHHAYDVFTHTAHVVEAVPSEPALRWAALLHDVAKPSVFTMDENGRGHFKGHAAAGAQMANEILRRLKAPTALREQVVFLVEHHMLPLEPDPRILKKRLGKYGEERVFQLLALQKADFSSKGTGLYEDPGFAQTEALLTQLLQERACFSLKDLAITGRDLIDLGLSPGPDLGSCLSQLLEQVQNEELPNEKSLLLEAAKERYL